MLLGVGHARVSDPRIAARILAAQRSEDIAAAVWAPLDDSELSPAGRQAAVLKALDATFPLQTTSIEVELPAEPDELEGMNWQDLQGLARRTLSLDS